MNIYEQLKEVLIIDLTVSNNFDGDEVWNAVESRNAAAYIMNNALLGK
ncbi:hypothetical protein [Priestia flexa]